MEEFRSYWQSWLRHWHDLMHPEGPEWSDEYCAAGMFNALWNDKPRLAACLSPLPKAETLTTRISEIIDAAGVAAAASGGGYYVVRDPRPASDDDLRNWASQFYMRCRELTGVPHVQPVIEIVRSADPISAYVANFMEGDDGPHDTLDDWVSDVLSTQCTAEERAAYYVLDEALYTMACTYKLVEYVRWAFVEEQVSGFNPYRAQFELWRSGAFERFRMEEGVKVFAPVGGHAESDRARRQQP